jgi:hypothetical protein
MSLFLVNLALVLPAGVDRIGIATPASQPDDSTCARSSSLPDSH